MAARKKPRRGKRPAKPTAIERAYANELLKLVRACRPAINAAVEKFKRELDAARKKDSFEFAGHRYPIPGARVVHEDAAAPVSRSLAGVRVQLDTVVNKARPGLIAQGVGKRTTAFAVKATDTSVRGIVTIPASTVVKGINQRAFVADNVALIKSIPKQLFAQVEAEMNEAWAVGRDTRVFARHIEERFGVAESRARLIAIDQVGKLNGQVAAKRSQDLGIVEFTWSTSLDERVRGNPSGLYPDADPSHWEREGKVYRYDDPPEDGLPGYPVRCRCVAIPVIPDDIGDE